MKSMRNPLVETCLQISRAGYQREGYLQPEYFERRLLALGTFLLNDGADPALRLHSDKPALSISDKQEVAICFGAGIDSYCALIWAAWQGKKIHLIHVNYGQPYWQNEHNVFHEIQTHTPKSLLSDDLSVDEHALIHFHSHSVDLIPKEDQQHKDFQWHDYIIPARNLVLAAIGAQYAQLVWVVANKREDETIGARDKTTRFYREASIAFTQFYGFPVAVKSPFIRWSKREVVERYIEGGGSIEALKQTWSCYTFSKKQLHCGICYQCYKRFKLFQSLNVEHDFQVHPQKGEHFYEYERREQSKGRT